METELKEKKKYKHRLGSISAPRLKAFRRENEAKTSQGAMMLELMREKPGQNNRATKRDTDARDIEDVVLELLARACSVQDSFSHPEQASSDNATG